MQLITNSINQKYTQLTILADFSIKNYLVLSTSGRYDTYTTLYPVVVKGNGGLFAPSGSAAFIYSEFLHWSALDFGKLRVSYAQTSGEPGTPYISQQYYNINNPVNGVITGGFFRRPSKLLPETIYFNRN